MFYSSLIVKYIPLHEYNIFLNLLFVYVFVYLPWNAGIEASAFHRDICQLFLSAYTELCSSSSVMAQSLHTLTGTP